MAEVDLRAGRPGPGGGGHPPPGRLSNGRGGRNTEIDPPSRLVLTWNWATCNLNALQLIEKLDFDEADGVTTVRFTHSGLWDEEAVRSHESGWGKAFDNLERTLASARS